MRRRYTGRDLKKGRELIGLVLGEIKRFRVGLRCVFLRNSKRVSGVGVK